MTEWIDDIDLAAARIRAWNRRCLRATVPLDNVQNVAAICFLELSDPLSDQQRQLFRELLLSDDITDEQRLQRLTALRALLRDVRVHGGMRIPADIDTTDQRVIFEVRCGLKILPEPTLPDDLRGLE
jgi:hypothetical protein